MKRPILQRARVIYLSSNENEGEQVQKRCGNFVVSSRDCHTSMLNFIVIQIRKVTREMGRLLQSGTIKNSSPDLSILAIFKPKIKEPFSLSRQLLERHFLS